MCEKSRPALHQCAENTACELNTGICVLATQIIIQSRKKKIRISRYVYFPISRWDYYLLPLKLKRQCNIWRNGVQYMTNRDGHHSTSIYIQRLNLEYSITNRQDTFMARIVSIFFSFLSVVYYETVYVGVGSTAQSVCHLHNRTRQLSNCVNSLALSTACEFASVCVCVTHSYVRICQMSIAKKKTSTKK